MSGDPTLKVENMNSTQVVPFLTWAGGKRWLTSFKEDIFPKQYNRYIEPFLGSGAIFFNLKPKRALLSDTNKELIQTYQAIKTNWQKVEFLLKKHHRLHSSEHYYKIRNSKPYSSHGKAAKFIYLNRTCWNGLYRVNLQGKFNVPIGTKKSVIYNTDNYELISNLLTDVELISNDFEYTIDQAQENDLLFVDPPYTVKHNHNNFIKYNEKLFSWEDQIRLRDCLIRARDRNVKIISTNANHSCLKEIYKDFKCDELSRNSLIAASSNKRGRIKELLITI